METYNSLIITNMDLQKKLLSLGVSEQEMMDELRGSYNTSFFHIYTAGDFNTDLSQISQKDRGTFIHEYIHYWQNIATLWGLASSTLCYEAMLKLKENILASEEIQLPYNIPFTENMKKCNDYFSIGNGFSQDKRFHELKINQQQRIKIDTKKQTVHDKDIPVIPLTITFENGATETIELGAHIIKESMAALYQSLVDPDAEHDDIPYNVIKILCKQNYPSLYNNTKLLICACHAALFSMIPGETLISLLAQAEKQKITDGMQLFTDYIDQSTIKTKNSKDIPIPDFFDGMVNQFLKKLDENLKAPLDYIKEVLERVRLSNKMLPLLTVLYEEKNNSISTDNLNAIIAWLGIPYIQTKENGQHNPATALKKADEIVEGDDSMDVLELIALEAMYLFFSKEQPYRCCPLFGVMCKGSLLAKEECFNTPWKGTTCTFTVVTDSMNLQNKNIHW